MIVLLDNCSYVTHTLTQTHTHTHTHTNAHHRRQMHSHISEYILTKKSMAYNNIMNTFTLNYATPGTAGVNSRQASFVVPHAKIIDDK